MDRRRFEKLRRGRMEPEARIDLHGMTAERAHAALTGFILRAHDEDLRLVLVITGKGRAEEHRALPAPPRHPAPQRAALARRAAAQRPRPRRSPRRTSATEARAPSTSTSAAAAEVPHRGSALGKNSCCPSILKLAIAA